MRRKWHSRELSVNWPTKVWAVEKVMANTLDMVGLVWRVLQLSPKPFGTVISSFIDPGSRIKLLNESSFWGAWSLEIPRSFWNSKVLGRYRSSLSLEPILRQSILPPTWKKNSWHPFILSTTSYQYSVYFRSCITLVFLCFPTTILFVYDISLFIIFTTVFLWSPLQSLP